MSDTVNACTEKQAKCLERNGYNPADYDFDSASELIDALKANNWKPLTEPGAPKPTQAPTSGPAKKSATGGVPKKGEAPKSDLDPNGPLTAKQAKVLDKYDYETEGVTFQQACDLIDKIAANNWKPLE